VVGLDTRHLVDASRPDPWVPQSGPRQLMVSMYYPALPRTGRPAPYMNPAEADALLTFAELNDKVSATAFADTRTSARAGAIPLPGRYPLVVLSPGFSVPRYELTRLAEDLASKGFVVASIDHAYESTATQFPIGGDATAATMETDRRVRAGASMSGPFTPVIPASGLDRRPFLMFGDAGAEAPGVDPTWDASWPNLDGWKRWLTVSNGDRLHLHRPGRELIQRAGSLWITTDAGRLGDSLLFRP